MRTWFAVYAIPPEGSHRYRRGSAVLGYDIRRGAPSALAPGGDLADLDPAWTEAARGFGFHVTLVEAYAFDAADPEAAAAHLDAIAAEVRDLLTALHPESRFVLEPRGLVRWRDGSVWVLRYAASRALDIAQAVLAARLVRYADHSMFVDEDRDHPDRYPNPYQRARMRRLLTPRGLDSWCPHATLLNRYDGSPDPALAARLEGAFADLGSWRVDRLALVVRAAGAERWAIAREFRLPGGEPIVDDREDPNEDPNDGEG